MLATLIAPIASSSGILAVALLMVAIMLVRRKRKRQEKQDSEAQQVVPHFSKFQDIFLLFLRPKYEYYSSRTGLLDVH